MTPDNIYKPGEFKPELPKSLHLVNGYGTHRIVRLGFCWLGFLLPPIWAMSEGLWRPFALSLFFFLSGRIFEAAQFSCEQGASCAAMPFAGLLNLVGLASYAFAMGYFGYRGKAMLIADLLKHGYFIEGTSHPVEPDEYES